MIRNGLRIRLKMIKTCLYSYHVSHAILAWHFRCYDVKYTELTIRYMQQYMASVLGMLLGYSLKDLKKKKLKRFNHKNISNVFLSVITLNESELAFVYTFFSVACISRQTYTYSDHFQGSTFMVIWLSGTTRSLVRTCNICHL